MHILKFLVQLELNLSSKASVVKFCQKKDCGESNFSGMRGTESDRERGSQIALAEDDFCSTCLLFLNSRWREREIWPDYIPMQDKSHYCAIDIICIDYDNHWVFALNSCSYCQGQKHHKLAAFLYVRSFPIPSPGWGDSSFVVCTIPLSWASSIKNIRRAHIERKVISVGLSLEILE